MLADVDARTAMVLAEQVRTAVARLTVVTREGVAVRVTVSAGVTIAAPDHPMESADDLVDAAERALYAAQRAGGDRVTSASRPRVPPARPVPALG